MDDTTKRGSASAEDDPEVRNPNDFLRISESDFAVVVLEAVGRLLDCWGITDPRFVNLHYSGVILDKPGLMIRIGNAEFQVIILKTC